MVMFSLRNLITLTVTFVFISTSKAAENKNGVTNNQNVRGGADQSRNANGNWNNRGNRNKGYDRNNHKNNRWGGKHGGGGGFGGVGGYWGGVNRPMFPGPIIGNIGNQIIPLPGVSNTCNFPWGDGNFDNVVAITRGAANAGWAMSPDQTCKPGSWCPYACKPGYYSAQWDPKALLYNGPGSMNGGLYCGLNGVLQKPFPDRPFCKPGMMNVKMVNALRGPVSACQTVYPGNEAMIIPTVVYPGQISDINVVPRDYWLGTSSQFYVNLEGSTNTQCIWGQANKPVGNWGPYIFGAGQGKDGNTYVSVQYNPLYKQSGFDPKNAYNVKIVCRFGKCNFGAGNECKCEKGVCSQANGCTVTLTQGAVAHFVLYR
ncbi:hypothetical protein AX774_g2685 [Zancudomyces culisetae]|uniref:Secreted beta-glucosidase adg3 n=1 Tax=Zancudomyces culisetae TaxID=1213189 RepID=A0A1R1PSD3_ZANCU|nr:hypothetical protein AX774_g2685 [Zancudomyces culisetae]|eukprot:OMH83803.1 hypothetical protein AX774_g2685 [Zancudomyces culisetae]